MSVHDISPLTGHKRKIVDRFATAVVTGASTPDSRLGFIIKMLDHLPFSVPLDATYPECKLALIDAISELSQVWKTSARKTTARNVVLSMARGVSLTLGVRGIVSDEFVQATFEAFRADRKRSLRYAGSRLSTSMFKRAYVNFIDMLKQTKMMHEHLVLSEMDEASKSLARFSESVVRRNLFAESEWRLEMLCERFPVKPSTCESVASALMEVAARIQLLAVKQGKRQLLDLSRRIARTPPPPPQLSSLYLEIVTHVRIEEPYYVSIEDKLAIFKDIVSAYINHWGTGAIATVYNAAFVNEQSEVYATPAGPVGPMARRTTVSLQTPRSPPFCLWELACIHILSLPLSDGTITLELHGHPFARIRARARWFRAMRRLRPQLVFLRDFPRAAESAYAPGGAGYQETATHFALVQVHASR